MAIRGTRGKSLHCKPNAHSILWVRDRAGTGEKDPADLQVSETRSSTYSAASQCPLPDWRPQQTGVARNTAVAGPATDNAPGEGRGQTGALACQRRGHVRLTVHYSSLFSFLTPRQIMKCLKDVVNPFIIEKTREMLNLVLRTFEEMGIYGPLRGGMLA